MSEPRRKLFLWFLIGGGALLILAGGLSVLLNRPARVVPTAAPTPIGQVQRVSLEDAKTAFDDGSAVFLDVRSVESYQASHIPGALSIPSNELPARLGELDQGAWIIPY